MTRKLALFLAVLVTLFVACTPKQDTIPPPRPTPVVTDTEFCDAAEANLIKLGCPEGKPTKRGKRFGDVCRELHENGIFVNPRCLATISLCASVDVCTGTVVVPK
jgi:nitrous oxide reductase accessory protein NosL